MEVDTPASGPSTHPLRPPRTSQNTPTRGRGGRPGFYSGEVQRFHPERRGDKTLVVEKIPEDKLSLDAVNSWFKRFGTVTNVAVDAASAKALVSFSTHEEAQAAWKTEDAVFGNRFVKVFWHRPMGGQGLAGQRALAASAPIVASVVAKEQKQVAAPTSDAMPVDPQSSHGDSKQCEKGPLVQLVCIGARRKAETPRAANRRAESAHGEAEHRQRRGEEGDFRTATQAGPGDQGKHSADGIHPVEEAEAQRTTARGS
jgi:hypothetical protein